MAELTEKEKDELKIIENLLNNINLGTAKAAIGRIFVGLMQRVQTLEDAGGDGSSETVTWETLTGKPSTFPPRIGTTANDAKAGNYAPPAASTTVAGVVQIGTGALQAAPGNHSHAAATTSVAGFMSATDKDKLDKIAASATANDTDANLKSRSNHTGTQAISTISGLQAALDAKATSASLDLLAARVTALETP